MTTAPHLARLDLTYATAADLDAYAAQALQIFGETFDPATWPGREIFEADRTFGFTTEGRWVATCAAYSRTMTVPGGAVPTAAVTFVTVAPSYRRRGLLTQMMRHQLDDVVRRGTEPVALLWASEAPIYGRFGYGPTTHRLHVAGDTRSTGFRPDVDLGGGSVGEVTLDEWRAVVERLHARLLPERPGALDRSPAWWTVVTHDSPERRRGASAVRYALHHDASGEPDGYLSFRTAGSADEASGMEVRVTSLDASDSAGSARLWRFVLDLDLVRRFSAEVAVDDPLQHLVADSRAVERRLADGTYARVVDLPRALEARRYAAEVDLVLGVRDAMLPQNDGTFRLTGGLDGASVRRVSEEPDVELDVRELGAVYLGGTSPAVLHRAGLVGERRPGAVAALTAALSWSRLPVCHDFF
jgi:predicted acetyltransferase